MKIINDILQRLIGICKNINISYLTSDVSSEKYTVYLRGNLLSFVGYSIATLETFMGIYLGLTDLTYKKTLSITIPILILYSVITAITYFKRDLKVWHELLFFFIYLFSFLFAFCAWIYGLGNLRFLGILNAVCAVTVVMAYTNTAQSLLLSISTLLCYFAVMFYSIHFEGQIAPYLKEAFLTFCLLPVFLLIASASDYLNKKSNALVLVKNDLQKLNDELTDANNKLKVEKAVTEKVKNDLQILNHELTDVNNKLKYEQAITEIEMDLASEIQKAIFLSNAPATADWDIAFSTRPYGAVSGDFYDFYSRDNTLQGIALFDVSGHGVAPALITILAKPLLYSHFTRCGASQLGCVIESVNEEITGELEQVNLYITGILLRMKGSEVEYVNAGHPDLLYFQPSSRDVRVMEDRSNSYKGHPVGISFSDNTYKSLKFTVQTGDFIILYSDGLIELKNNAGEQFGITRLTDVVSSFTGYDAVDLLNHILESSGNFAGETKASDDITIIVAVKI